MYRQHEHDHFSQPPELSATVGTGHGLLGQPSGVAAMAIPLRARKRVHAIANGIRRGPDGSAFEKCRGCGVSVAIALADMHDCGLKRDVKRFKGQRGVQLPRKQTCLGEPRSPFRLFMESFRKACKTRNPIDVDRIGFEAWKNMSMEERKPYIIQAEKVNSAHLKILLKEEDDRVEVDDEADSAMVGKFDKFYGFYEDSEDSDSFQSFRSKTIESFNTLEWGRVLSWLG